MRRQNGSALEPWHRGAKQYASYRIEAGQDWKLTRKLALASFAAHDSPPTMVSAAQRIEVKEPDVVAENRVRSFLGEAPGCVRQTAVQLADCDWEKGLVDYDWRRGPSLAQRGGSSVPARQDLGDGLTVVTVSGQTTIVTGGSVLPTPAHVALANYRLTGNEIYLKVFLDLTGDGLLVPISRNMVIHDVYDDTGLIRGSMQAYGLEGMAVGIASGVVVSKTIGPAVNLPAVGARPFVPKKVKGGILRDNRGGYIDKNGNSWRWDSVKKEWDVQHRDGRHTNVNAQGEITHGPDLFGR